MNYCTINGSFEEDFFCKFIEEVKKFNQEEPLTVFIVVEPEKCQVFSLAYEWLENLQSFQKILTNYI